MGRGTLGEGGLAWKIIWTSEARPPEEDFLEPVVVATVEPHEFPIPGGPLGLHPRQVRIVQVEAVLFKIRLHLGQSLLGNGFVAFPLAASMLHASEKAKGGQRVAQDFCARQTQEFPPHVDVCGHAYRGLAPALGLVVNLPGMHDGREWEMVFSVAFDARGHGPHEDRVLHGVDFSRGEH